MLSGSLAKCLCHARRYKQTFASTYYRVMAVVCLSHIQSPRCRIIGLPSEYSLDRVTDRAGQGIPRKDRCLVNVLRYMPAEIAEFCHPRAQLGLPCTGLQIAAAVCCSSVIHERMCCLHVAACNAINSMAMCWSKSLLVAAEADESSWTYLVKLHLQDATGEIDASLFDKDADEFFKVRGIAFAWSCTIAADCS